MRKILTFLSFIFVFVLVGCVWDPASYRFDTNNLLQETVAIELVVFRNYSPVKVRPDKQTLTIDIDEMVLVDSLDDLETESFLNELSQITFHLLHESSVNSPVGFSVLIRLKGSEMIVLSFTEFDSDYYSMCAKFTYDGIFIEHIAEFAEGSRFIDLMHKYFGVY